MTLLHHTSRPNVCICLGAFWSPHLLCEHEGKTKEKIGYTNVNPIVWAVAIVFQFFKGGVGKWVGVLLWGWGPRASQTYPKSQLNNLHYFAAHLPLPPQKPTLH